MNPDPIHQEPSFPASRGTTAQQLAGMHLAAEEDPGGLLLDVSKRGSFQDLLDSCCAPPRHRPVKEDIPENRQEPSFPASCNQALPAERVRVSVLKEAIAIVSKDRQNDYGTPENNFGLIAALLSAYLGILVQPHDVAVIQILVKVARTKTSPKKKDNWVDISGYGGCGAEVAGAE